MRIGYSTASFCKLKGVKEGSVAMTDGVESVVRELIAKVESSQSLIDELRLELQDLSSKLDSQEEVLIQSSKLQSELEYYFLLSQKQFEIIAANEELQKRAIDILVNLNRQFN